MFSIEKKEGEQFEKVFNAFRTNTKNLRLQQMVRDKMFHQRKMNKRKKKQAAKMANWYRSENLRKSFYA